MLYGANGCDVTGFDPWPTWGFCEFGIWFFRTLCWVSFFSPSDPFKPFIIFSNRHEIRRIDLHKGEFSVLVPGLRNTIALDFHLNQSTLYWTDVVEDKIYRGKLSENGGEAACCVLFFLFSFFALNSQILYLIIFLLKQNSCKVVIT